MNTKSKPKPNVAIFKQVCQTMRLPEPVPEYRFHPDRQWRIDFYFEANGRKVALEVEGGVFTSGRHTRGTGFLGDMEKYNAMAMQQIFLVRCTPGDLMKLKTLNAVKAVLYG